MLEQDNEDIDLNVALCKVSVTISHLHDIARFLLPAFNTRLLCPSYRVGICVNASTTLIYVRHCPLTNAKYDNPPAILSPHSIRS